MKKKLYTITSLLLALIIIGCNIGTKTIKLGAAGLGGMYYSFASAFTELASTENEDYNFEVKSTAGSTANIRLLSEGYIDMCIAQADLIHDAYYGSGNFTNNKYRGYKAVAGLYNEACQIVVRADSSINSLDDLQGKTINIGEKESGTERNANLILQMSGLSSDIVNTVNLNYTNAAKKLKSGEIDALFCTAGVQTTVIEELARQCDIRLLSIDEKCINRITSSYDFYKEYTIPANTYTGQSEAIKTISVQSVLLASNDLPNDIVNNLTSMLFKHSQDIQYSISGNLQLDIDYAVQGVDIPFHPGAIEYYKENSINVPS
ncbi:TAXI family TRAP transporter solute-binding subunit [Clostridium sp. MSJ-8]|uniref:TAXI family TRAP transporter solute-binding subunit n=1 Tax=Clostridium sp. MSJ-8 TaxID=2841510 RepID=UPI001C0EB73A|nr:TAXI family TRAP transporter solute-binding subunit [Clostridium sp. MSJ-8]MBU5488158.1 TAXI family TRAP transporter solute-binding subunit [Clostridium sp. MSJ-8]